VSDTEPENVTARSEAEIFSDLERLCGSRGYIHVYAALVVKNTFVRYSNSISGDAFHETFGKDHLIRTELCTLLGLIIKAEIDFTLPTQAELGELEEKTLALLEELHVALSAGMFPSAGEGPGETFKRADFSEGAVLREPIFYTGESAYASQYRDFAPLKYKADDAWIRSHCGFTIAQAAQVGRAILALEQSRVGDLYNSLQSGVPDNFTFLPAFTFTAGDLVATVGESEETVLRVFNALSVGDGERNRTFQALNDFNAGNAQPMLRKAPDSFILFQAYSFYESLYESPFFWMRDDDSYKDTAFEHRGDFTEEFSAFCLSRVFGTAHTYSNVLLKENAATTTGEVDVLVLFANRALVVQTKSKRLTLEARKGNDGAIQKDFSGSIADSYQQALECGQHLLSRDRKCIDAGGKEIVVPKLKKIYLLCLVSDHYPALSLQAMEFLAPIVSNEIPAPFVTDIFTLDVLTEMLSSPLHLLSYIDRRTTYGGRVVTGHELNILGYHLSHNLWIPTDVTDIFLYDDVASSLDAAMAVRRDDVPGDRTPPGILTISKGSAYDSVISQVNNGPRGELVDLGLMLLRMSSDAAARISRGIEDVARRAQETRKLHDVTLGDHLGSGITIHSSYLPASVAVPRLHRHVRVSKYRQKASLWFGIAIHPDSGSLLFGVCAEFEWKRDDLLEEESRAFPIGRRVEVSGGRLRPRKIGRNDLCPCGSGKKYKKCHLNR
jgi:hypothetical protein